MEVRDLSEQYQVKVHTHASENPGEIEIVQANAACAMSSISIISGWRMISLILAHCVWLDDEEKRIIQERGVNVSHCPGSNLKLASGIADTRDC